ncbi:MAG TPA: porin family protein [Gemmatimonadales bacterium]|jgi:hypothetical protein
MIRRIAGLIGLCVMTAARLNGQISVSAVAGLVSLNWSFSTGCQDCQHALGGLAAGGAFNFPMGRRLSFAPELLYVRKGSGLDYPADVRIEYRVGYVEVPLLLRYVARTSGEVRPYIIAGPEFGITATCSAKAINSPANGSTVFVVPCTTGEAGISEDQPDPLDFGVIVGAGVTFHRLSASVRYDRGLTDIYSRYTGSGTVHNTAWLVLIAARL